MNDVSLERAYKAKAGLEEMDALQIRTQVSSRLVRHRQLYGSFVKTQRLLVRVAK